MVGCLKKKHSVRRHNLQCLKAIVLLTRLTKQDLGQVCTHDVIVRVCIYVGGAITGSCAEADVAYSGAVERCQGQLKKNLQSILCEQIA